MATKRKRGAYKFKFASNFDDAIVDPSTIRRWKKYAVDGKYFMDIIYLFIYVKKDFVKLF